MKMILAAAALLASAFTAVAADLPSRRPADLPLIVVATPATNWTGFYAGGNLGLSRLDGRATHSWAPSADFDRRGVTGGLQAGYNHQIGAFVVGVEGDIGLLSRANAKTVWDSGDSVQYRPGSDAYATLRGRLGYVFADRFMVYGTGGAAFLLDKNRVIEDTGSVISRSNWHDFGYAFGAGVDYALTRNVIIGADYMRMTFNRDRVGGSDGSFRSDIDMVRIKASYRF